MRPVLRKGRTSVNPSAHKQIRNFKMYKQLPYTSEMFQNDYMNLVRLYNYSKLSSNQSNADIYFRIKFFRLLKEIPFINYLPYTCLQDGLVTALEDLEDLSKIYFQQVQR